MSFLDKVLSPFRSKPVGRSAAEDRTPERKSDAPPREMPQLNFENGTSTPPRPSTTAHHQPQPVLLDEDDQKKDNLHQQPPDCRASSILRAEWYQIQDSVFLLIDAVRRAECSVSSASQPIPNVSRSCSRTRLLIAGDDNDGNSEVVVPPLHLESSPLRDSFKDMCTYRNTVASLGTEAHAEHVNFCAQKSALLDAESRLRAGAAVVDNLPRLFSEFSLRAVSTFTAMREEHEKVSAACEVAATVERERLTAAVRSAAQAHADITNGVLHDMQDIIDTKNREIEMLKGMASTMNRFDPAVSRRHSEIKATVDDMTRLKEQMEFVTQSKENFETVVLDVMRIVNSVNIVDASEIPTTTPARKRRPVVDMSASKCAGAAQQPRHDRDDVKHKKEKKDKKDKKEKKEKKREKKDNAPAENARTLHREDEWVWNPRPEHRSAEQRGAAPQPSHAEMSERKEKRARDDD
eukprot:PhM_4_TR2739/c0_g1_i1/m.52342